MRIIIIIIGKVEVNVLERSHEDDDECIPVGTYQLVSLGSIAPKKYGKIRRK